MVELDVKVEEPGDANVHNNAFYAEETLLKSELEAMRDCNPSSARHWIVSFPTIRIAIFFFLSQVFPSRTSKLFYTKEIKPLKHELCCYTLPFSFHFYVYSCTPTYTYLAPEV